MHEPNTKGKTNQKQDDILTGKIIGAAIEVHRRLGPGLLESVYEVCFCYELERIGLKAERQIPTPLIYEGIKFDLAFRLDVLVEDLVICELKAIDSMHPVFEAQLLSHLRLTHKRLGFLINFNVPLIKNGIKRMVL